MSDALSDSKACLSSSIPTLNTRMTQHLTERSCRFLKSASEVPRLYRRTNKVSKAQICTCTCFSIYFILKQILGVLIEGQNFMFWFWFDILWLMWLTSIVLDVIHIRVEEVLLSLSVKVNKWPWKFKVLLIICQSCSYLDSAQSWQLASSLNCSDVVEL